MFKVPSLKRLGSIKFRKVSKIDDTLRHPSPVHTGKTWFGTYFWSSECTAEYWRNCEWHPGINRNN